MATHAIRALLVKWFFPVQAAPGLGLTLLALGALFPWGQTSALASQASTVLTLRVLPGCLTTSVDGLERRGEEAVLRLTITDARGLRSHWVQTVILKGRDGAPDQPVVLKTAAGPGKAPDVMFLEEQPLGPGSIVSPVRSGGAPAPGRLTLAMTLAPVAAGDLVLVHTVQ